MGQRMVNPRLERMDRSQKKKVDQNQTKMIVSVWKYIRPGEYPNFRKLLSQMSN